MVTGIFHVQTIFVAEYLKFAGNFVIFRVQNRLMETKKRGNSMEELSRFHIVSCGGELGEIPNFDICGTFFQRVQF